MYRRTKDTRRQRRTSNRLGDEAHGCIRATGATGGGAPWMAEAQQRSGLEPDALIVLLKKRLQSAQLVRQELRTPRRERGRTYRSPSHPISLADRIRSEKAKQTCQDRAP